MVRLVTNLDEFNTIVEDKNNEGKLIVVDFYATWCGPCSRIAPKIEEWSNNDYKDKVVFIKVDVDQSDDISGKYNVEAMPTFVFLKDGKEVNRIVGADQTKLKAAIDEKK